MSRAPRKGQRVYLRPIRMAPEALWSTVRYEYIGTHNGYWAFNQVGGGSDFIFRDPNTTLWQEAPK